MRCGCTTGAEQESVSVPSAPRRDCSKVAMAALHSEAAARVSTPARQQQIAATDCKLSPDCCKASLMQSTIAEMAAVVPTLFLHGFVCLHTTHVSSNLGTNSARTPLLDLADLAISRAGECSHWQQCPPVRPSPRRSNLVAEGWKPCHNTGCLGRASVNSDYTFHCH